MTSGPGSWIFSGGRPGDLGQEVPALSQSAVGVGRPRLRSTAVWVRFCSVLPPSPALITVITAPTEPPLLRCPSLLQTRSVTLRPSTPSPPSLSGGTPGSLAGRPTLCRAAPSTAGPLGLPASSSCSAGVGGGSWSWAGVFSETLCVSVNCIARALLLKLHSILYL